MEPGGRGGEGRGGEGGQGAWVGAGKGGGSIRLCRG